MSGNRKRKKERKKETNACLGGIGRLWAPQRRENPRPCTTRKDGAPRDTLEDRLSATRRKKKQIPQCVRDDSGGEGAGRRTARLGRRALQRRSRTPAVAGGRGSTGARGCRYLRRRRSR